MKQNILIGIDLGTTVLKCAAFDERTGKLLAKASTRLKISAGKDGKREQTTASIDRGLKTTINDLAGQIGDGWKNVVGVGMAAQGGSGCIVDRKTGKALTPMLLWNDSRPYKYLPEIARKKSTRFWRSLAVNDSPGMGLARLIWFRKKNPRLLRKSNIYVGAGEYAYFRLTGVWRQDACNALQIGCYNVAKDRLDQRPLDLVDLPLSFVAPLREGHEKHTISQRAASTLNLPEGIPVVGPYMDHEAGYLSAFTISKRPLQVSLGTAWVGNYLLRPNVYHDSFLKLVIPSPLGEGKLIIQPLMTGNVTWDWGLSTLVDNDHEKAISKLEEIFRRELLPPRGLVALPWFNRANPFDSSAIGAGMYFGLNSHTSSEDLLRALAASMTYEFRRVFQSVKSHRAFDSIVLGGGASKGTFFQKLFAALFSPIPVFTLEDEDTAGARGAIFDLSERAAKAKPKRVPSPAPKTAKRIVDDYKYYLKMFERICR